MVEGWHGLPYDKPVARMREVVDIVRRVLRRDVIEHAGAVSIPLPAGQGTGLGKPLKLLNHPERTDVPVYVAALGIRSVASMASYADGWMPTMFVPERAHEVWGDALDEGLAKRPGDLGPLEIVAGGVVAIGDDVKGALDAVRAQFALYIGGMGARGKNFYNTVVCQLGWEAEALEIQELYLAGRKDEAAALVPRELLEATNLVGPEGYVRDRIAAYREAGVTNLVVRPSADPVGTMATMRRLVDDS